MKGFKKCTPCVLDSVKILLSPISGFAVFSFKTRVCLFFSLCFFRHPHYALSWSLRVWGHWSAQNKPDHHRVIYTFIVFFLAFNFAPSERWLVRFLGTSQEACLIVYAESSFSNPNFRSETKDPFSADMRIFSLYWILELSGNWTGVLSIHARWMKQKSLNQISEKLKRFHPNKRRQIICYTVCRGNGVLFLSTQPGVKWRARIMKFG